MAKKDRKLVPAEHLDQALYNEDFAQALFALKAPHYDWLVIACFYSALHYVYYKLAPDSIQTSHIKLDALLAKSYDQKSIVWQLYKKLQNRSENCRYYPYISTHYRNDRPFAEDTLKKLDRFKQELGV